MNSDSRLPQGFQVFSGFGSGASSQPGPTLAEVAATTTAAKGIARGDLSQRVPVTSKDEVGELAATFNHMAAELQRAEQLRRNMTADVAHELCTPLSVVWGKLEGVLDEVYPATPEHLQPVLEATELLTVLVEDLRLLAQAEAGQLAWKKGL